MSLIKSLEIKILAAEIWSETFLLVATTKAQLKIFNKNLEEKLSIDLDGLRVN